MLSNLAIASAVDFSLKEFSDSLFRSAFGVSFFPQCVVDGTPNRVRRFEFLNADNGFVHADIIDQVQPRHTNCGFTPQFTSKLSVRPLDRG